MSGKTISQALGSITDANLESAMYVYARKRKSRMLWRSICAAAAVLAILLTAALWPSAEESYVTGPGLLVVRAYALDEDANTPIEEVILEEGVKFISNGHYDPKVSLRQHFPFSFSVDNTLYSGMEITLEVTTDAGIFYNNDPLAPPFSSSSTPDIVQTSLRYYGQHFTVDIDKKIYWEPWGFDYAYWQEQIAQGNLDHESTYKPHLFEKNPSFIDVIIRANDYIIGYCVLEIRETNGITGWEAENFCFEVLAMTSFPEIDGRWQKVTLKYVQEQINNIHAEREVIT